MGIRGKSISELREIGNRAFKNEDWEASIEAYTEAIRKDGQDAALYSNRSAAYLKYGNFEAALDDAEKCITIKPDYHLGYSRKGSVLHAMKQYDGAIECYREGIEACHHVEALERGLAQATAAKLDSSEAQSARLKSNLARRASESQSQMARAASSVSSFVQQKRREIKLQIAALEAQLDFIDLLAGMSDKEKMELLFNVVDHDRDGKVDARELAKAMRRRNQELTFSASLERAINMVAIFDADGDARLNYMEFQEFISVMMSELDVSFQEFAEFMVLQNLFADKETDKEEEEEKVDRDEVDKEVKDRGLLLEILADPRLLELFELMDKSGTRELTFKDVARGLFLLSRNMEQSTKTTMELLLMVDKEDHRVINYEQFGRLMLGVAAARGSSFEQVANDLILALMKGTELSIDEEARLLVADAEYADFKRPLHESTPRNGSVTKLHKGVDALAYGRLQKLFDLWDKNEDGFIEYKDMIEGFHKFERSTGRKDTGYKQTFSQIGLDEDLKKQLDRTEFANCISRYAKIVSADLHTVIDFMCLTAVLPDERAEMYHQAYSYTRHIDRNGTAPVVKPVHLDYFEAPTEKSTMHCDSSIDARLNGSESSLDVESIRDGVPPMKASLVKKDVIKSQLEGEDSVVRFVLPRSLSDDSLEGPGSGELSTSKKGKKVEGATKQSDSLRPSSSDTAGSSESSTPEKRRNPPSRASRRNRQKMKSEAAFNKFNPPSSKSSGSSRGEKPINRSLASLGALEKGRTVSRRSSGESIIKFNAGTPDSPRKKGTAIKKSSGASLVLPGADNVPSKSKKSSEGSVRILFSSGDSVVLPSFMTGMSLDFSGRHSEGSDEGKPEKDSPSGDPVESKTSESLSPTIPEKASLESKKKEGLHDDPPVDPFDDRQSTVDGAIRLKDFLADKEDPTDSFLASGGESVIDMMWSVADPLEAVREAED